MKLYFDTNIYNFINFCSETHKVSSFLKRSGISVEASSENLLEIYQIKDFSEKKSKVFTLTTIASKYEDYPQSYFQANEVRREINRCRRLWLKEIVLKNKINEFLRQHTNNWKEAKKLNVPKHDDEGYKQFHTDFNSGIEASIGFQKTIREHLLKSENVTLTLIDNSETEQFEIAANLNNAEDWWRAINLSGWYGAIVTQNPSSRDYADWLNPYIKSTAFKAVDYNDFWFKDVIAENVPRNRLIGLIDYYQHKYRITSGNSLDQLHSCHIFDVDYFFTADKVYHKILKIVIANHFGHLNGPILINRNSNSVYNEIVIAIDLLRNSPPAIDNLS